MELDLQYGEEYKIRIPSPLRGTAAESKTRSQWNAFYNMAGRTGFEPATEDFAPVTA